MNLEVSQAFNVSIYHPCVRGSHSTTSGFVFSFADVCKEISKIIWDTKWNIPAEIFVEKFLYLVDMDTRIKNHVRLSQINFFVVQHSIPTLADLRKSPINCEKLGCVEDCGLCKDESKQNLPAVSNAFETCGIRLLNPHNDIVCQKGDLHQVYPQPMNAVPKKLVDFFETPISLLMTHGLCRVK